VSRPAAGAWDNEVTEVGASGALVGLGALPATPLCRESSLGVSDGTRTRGRRDHNPAKHVLLRRYSRRHYGAYDIATLSAAVRAAGARATLGTATTDSA
jgi:hypothetical protein